MPVIDGEDMLVDVNTGTDGAPIWTPVADMNRFEDTVTRQRQTNRVFGGTKYVSNTGRDHTATLSGFNNPTDPGQSLLKTREGSDTELELRIREDGVTGFRQKFKVDSYARGRGAEDGLQTISFSLTSTNDPTAV